MGATTTIDYKAEYEKRHNREQKAYRRRAVKIDLILKKAEAAGIVVTEAEVTAEYNKKFLAKK